MKTIVKVIVLIATGWFLGSRLLFGTLNYYIHPRFNVLTVVTAVTLIIVALFYWFYHSRYGEDESINSLFNRERSLSWLSLLLLAAPVILGSVVQPRPLGAAALSNREVGLGTLVSAQTPGGSQLSTLNAGGVRNIVDWLYAFQRAAEPAEFNGEEASVIGFVYRDDRFTAGTFMVSRFTVSCCVADAAPVGLIVAWPEAEALADDAWVEVNGRFEAREFNGRVIPVLIAETIESTTPPNQPYLYQ